MNITGNTSEQVSLGHPDKIADRVSDSLVDAYLRKDRLSRLAIETAIKNNTVMVFGEVNTRAKGVDIDAVVKDVLYLTDDRYKEHGYELINRLSEQSPDIAMGTDDIVGGAGDQGIMVGYAVNSPETNYLPRNYYLATQILNNIENHSDFGPGTEQFGTDAKSQVTLNAEGKVGTVLVSCQHPESASSYEAKDFVNRRVSEVMDMYSERPGRVLINPTGRFTIGGAWGDAGLTGRKIIADTYGSVGRHGGGAFSGKDPSKVDRSAAYYARAVAKDLVRMFNVDWAEVRVAYAIGIPDPVEVSVNVPGSAYTQTSALMTVRNMDWTPKGIDNTLNLREWGNYYSSSYGGHFTSPIYPWEQEGILEKEV